MAKITFLSVGKWLREEEIFIGVTNKNENKDRANGGEEEAEK